MKDMIATSRQPSQAARDPFALRAKLSHRGTMHEISVVPDLVFGLELPDGSRRYFMVEIDRGTMPITRSHFNQTSFEKKMRGYLAAHAAKQHERQFGWKNFRVLTVTTDQQRVRSMKGALERLHVPRSPGGSLFLFGITDQLHECSPLAYGWTPGAGQSVSLI
jgi:hypothetical protein